jgi:hypothetical protein
MSSFKRFLKKVAKPVAVIAAIVYPPLIPMIGTALGATTVASAAIVGAAALSTGASLASGDSLEDALKSGVISGATAGLGQLSSGVTSGVADALGGGAAANIAANALTGGTLAEITGGDFAQGALISGVGSGINQAKLSLASDYLDSLPGGYGQYSDAPPDMSDFADLNPASFQIGDTTFAPDYSLGRGTSGAAGLSVAPIDTQYQVGSFDYSVGDLLDGLGLKMPNTPNLGTMGGGQGIILKTNGGYITENGFVPDSYVASLGDPESFINKPVVDVQLSLGELQDASELDISKKLAGLDVAKFLTPYALAALTKQVYDQSRDNNASGFAVVPIPGDWKSPEYNQTFTPSAPIDFGNPEMLAGTQFANPPLAQQPMDLSSLINTLNLQQPQQQFGMDQIVGSINDVPMSINDIINNLRQNTMQPFDMNQSIGQLNNAPASLNSIIAGIQSQYG